MAARLARMAAAIRGCLATVRTPRWATAQRAVLTAATEGSVATARSGAVATATAPLLAVLWAASRGRSAHVHSEPRACLASGQACESTAHGGASQSTCPRGAREAAVVSVPWRHSRRGGR